MNFPTTALSIYMDGRGPLVPIQTLTVSGTNMTGYYVNGSVGGTANINIENGAIVDLIEAGGGVRTDANITVNNSTLNGAETGRIYDIANGGNKDFTLGSAIFVDLVDLGTHTIAVNGSQLNGSIVTGGLGGAQTVRVNGSTIDEGGIYVASLGVNTISVTDSTVDATGSGVAAGLADFAQRLANAGYPVDISNVDNLAIGVFGTRSTLTLAGSTVTGDVGLLGVGANATYEMSVTDGSRIEGNLVHRGPAPASVRFDASAIVGDIRASNTDVVMRNGSTFEGLFETSAGSTSSLKLVDSTWKLTGNSNVTNLTNDPSLIDFAPPTGNPTLLSSYKTLTTNNYVGVNGGIRLNTYLRGDGSPSDRLIIDGGTATGSTLVVARDTGGGGALTTGNGILVIDAVNGGTTAPGAFTGFAVGGPYEYLLERGGSTPGSENDWFLRSSVVDPSDPTAPARPRFRQEVSLYSAVPPMAAIYGREMIGTLHERVGEEEQLKGRTDLRGDPYFNGAWGRVMGHWGHSDGNSLGIYGGGPEFDLGFGAFQAGTDIYAKEYENGVRDHAGLYAGFGHGEVDVTHNLLGRSFDAGSDDFNAYTIGGYWTRFWENNAYIDGVVQGTWYDVTAKSQRDALFGLADQQVDGFGFAMSLEGGYPFYFSDGWQLEPQAQMIYQAINFDSFNDGASEVNFDDTSSLPSRVGVRLARTWAVEEASGDKPARLATVWGRVNLWHNFLDDSVTTTFSSANGFVPFTAELEDSWIEADFGGTVELTPTTSLYGNVDFATSFDGDANSIGGKLGLRMNW